MQSYIVHSGIKGQKWGVRRFQNEDGSLTAEGKERYGQGEGHKKPKKEKPESATWKSKDARYLSDAELNRRNSRLQREQQYRQMTQSRGQRARKWILATAGAILVKTAINALSEKTKNSYMDLIKKNGPKIIGAVKKKAAPYAAAAMLRKAQKG